MLDSFYIFLVLQTATVGILAPGPLMTKGMSLPGLIIISLGEWIICVQFLVLRCQSILLIFKISIPSMEYWAFLLTSGDICWRICYRSLSFIRLYVFCLMLFLNDRNPLSLQYLGSQSNLADSYKSMPWGTIISLLSRFTPLHPGFPCYQTQFLGCD